MTEQVIFVNSYGCGFCTHVNKHTARAFFGFSKHHISQSLHCDGKIGNSHPSVTEAVAYFFAHGRVCHDVKIMTLNALREDAYGVNLHLCAEVVFLRNSLKDIAVRVCRCAVFVAHCIDHLLRNFYFRIEVTHHGVSHRMHAHATDAHIDTAYALLHFLLELILHTHDALRHLAHIVNATLANEGSRRLLGEGKHLNGAVGLLATSHTSHLRRA